MFIAAALATVCRTQARITIRGLTVMREMNMTCPGTVKCSAASPSDFSNPNDLSDMGARVKAYADLRYDNYAVRSSICAVGASQAECNRFCYNDCTYRAGGVGLYYYQEFINRINDTTIPQLVHGSYEYVCLGKVRAKPSTLGLEGWKVALIVVGVFVLVGVVVWVAYGSTQFLIEKYRERADRRRLKQTGEAFKERPLKSAREAKVI